jgi:hypothetical protein
LERVGRRMRERESGWGGERKEMYGKVMLGYFTSCQVRLDLFFLHPFFLLPFFLPCYHPPHQSIKPSINPLITESINHLSIHDFSSVFFSSLLF